MQRVVVQVPMSKELRNKAEAVSSDLGFSSVQEIIRVLLTQFSKKELGLKIEEVKEITDLSPRAERKFKKAVEEIKAGRNITKTKNVDEFLKLLHS